MIDDLFGSKTRVKLLHLFLSNPNRAFYVREITRKIDEQINSVRRELSNMLTIGVIKSESANNRLYYEVNQDYQHFAALQSIFVGGKLDSNVIEDNDWSKRLKPLGDVKIALLAGNMVHGSKSSVDVLLVGDLNKTQTKKFFKNLEEEEAKSLNYTTMSYSDFKYRLSVKDKFIAEILASKHTLLIDDENIL